MVGLIMGAAGAAAGLAASLIPDTEVTTEYKSYTPDPMSFKNAGLFNAAVDLGEQSWEETTYETPGIKKGLGIAASLLGAGAGIAGGLSGGAGKKTGGYDGGANQTMKSASLNGGIAGDLDGTMVPFTIQQPYDPRVPKQYQYGRSNKGV